MPHSGCELDSVLAPPSPRSPLSTTVASDNARIADHFGWRLCPQLQHRARLVFAGFGNEKMLEDTLGKCRDHESRDGTNKVLQNFRTWEIARQHKMLRQHEREEISVTTTLPMPRNTDMSMLFSARKRWSLMGDGIHEEQCDIDEEVLDDVALQSDARMIKRIVAEARVEAKKASDRADRGRRIASASFARQPAPKVKSRSKPKAKATPNVKPSRWWNTTTPSRELLDKFLPYTARVFVGEFNGCYRHTAPSQTPSANR